VRRSAPSLKTRLLLWQIAVFGGVTLIGGPILYFVMSYTLHRDRDTYLVGMAENVTADYLATGNTPATFPLPPRLLPDPVSPESEAPGAMHRPRHLLLCDSEGKVIASDGEWAPLAPLAVREAADSMTPAYADVRWSAEVLRTVAWPFRDRDGRVLVLEIGTSYRVIESVLGQGVVFLAVIEGVALLFLVLGSWFLTRRAFEPVNVVIHRLEQINEDNLAERLPEEDRSEELGRMVAAINRVLNRLDRAFRAQSRFSSDVAHEVRSPLTALRGEMEVALRRDRSAEEYRSVIVLSLEEVLRLASLAEDLMSLARADAGVLEKRHRPIELSLLLDRVVTRFGPASDAGGISLLLDAPEKLLVLGDSGLLGRLVDNLVDNALMHSALGQSILIRLTREGRQAVITVTDQGEGISPEHQERIFDRFYRVDKARSRDRGGTGLGLAIVREFAWLHHGSVGVTSTPGKGSSFRVELPLILPQSDLPGPAQSGPTDA
jgi:heavy metal sensor kinase